MITSSLKKFVKSLRTYKCYVRLKQYDQIIEENKCLKNKNQYLMDHFGIGDMLPEKGFYRKEQLNLVTFVRNFLDEVSSLNIKPFLIAGSLLGEFRHKGFIPWDDDIDFGLIRQDYNILLEHCKKAMPVYTYDGKAGGQFTWIDQCTKENAGKYILFIYDNQIQISMGTSIIDRKCIDFFAFDYYKENLEFKDYKSYLQDIYEKLSTGEMSVLEKNRFVQNEIAKSLYTESNSSKVYFGLDNMETFKRMFNNDWIPYDVLFPLRKHRFEDTEFWTPNKDECFLKYQYQDYYTYPNDFAQQTHGYWKEYMRSNYITVEFYLVDSFEIFHFIPYYHAFRKNGVYATFVAEPQDTNVAGRWFDFEKARQILIDNSLEYETAPNKNSTIAFTTQDAINLQKYSSATKRINLSYGYGLIKKSYAFCDRVLNGFDYKIVNGTFQNNQLSKINSGTVLMMGGLSKYSGSSSLDKADALQELGISTDKPILVYFPTYDEECCVDIFCESVEDLKEKYYVVVKMHHVLDRLKECSEIKQRIVEAADLILAGNYSFEKASIIADMIVADAKSGAVMESLYLNPEAKSVLLIKHENVGECYFEEIRKLGLLASTSEDFKRAMTNAITMEDSTARNLLIEDCYGKKEENYVEKVVEQLMEREGEKTINGY